MPRKAFLGCLIFRAVLTRIVSSAFCTLCISPCVHAHLRVHTSSISPLIENVPIQSNERRAGLGRPWRTAVVGTLTALKAVVSPLTGKSSLTRWATRSDNFRSDRTVPGCSADYILPRSVEQPNNTRSGASFHSPPTDTPGHSTAS